MTGQPRDKAWAQRQVVAQGGRPTRMSVWCLLLDRSEDAWRGMSREQQRAALEPYLLGDERLKWSNDGELFIVPGDGIQPRSVVADRPLAELQLERAQVAMWSDAKAKLTRSAIQQAYAQAKVEDMRLIVELEHKVLKRALSDDATVNERRLAATMVKDVKDRLMGKPVAPVEDVTQRPSDIRAFLASEAPGTLPLSASWTPETIAAEQLKQLEAGTLVLDEDG